MKRKVILLPSVIIVLSLALTGCGKSDSSSSGPSKHTIMSVAPTASPTVDTDSSDLSEVNNDLNDASQASSQSDSDANDGGSAVAVNDNP